MGDSEESMDLFSQDGVKLHKSPASYMQYINTSGTLYISEYLNSNRTRFIEWKPNDVTMEDTQEQDWTVLTAVTNGGRRTRTFSSGGSSAETNKSKHIKLNMEDIKSFKTSHSNQRISFRDGKGDVLAEFHFPSNNCYRLVIEMRNLLRTTVSKRDKHLFIVLNDIAELRLSKSFADINLFQDDHSFFVWNVVKNFQQNPYVTTMQAFSKISDIVYKSPETGMASDISAELQRSLTELEGATITHTQGDYEMIQHVPKLPDRKDYPRGNPLTSIQWRSLQDNEGRIEDVHSTNLVIFRGGVTPELRATVWPYLLGHHRWQHTRAERDEHAVTRQRIYYTMKSQWLSISRDQEERFADYRERKSLIEKDVNRTDRTMPFYAGDDNANLATLHDVLMTYVMYNFDLGYVQGMSDLLSPLLYLLRDEVLAFWCFAGFMDKVCSNFDVDQAGMKEQLDHLHSLLTFVDPDLASYLDRHESGNMFFCFRWLLVWFKRELNQDDVMLLWEVLWTGLPCMNFHLVFCVAILVTEKQTLIQNGYGFTEILKHINELSSNIDLPSMLNMAEGIYHQIAQADHVTNKIRMIVGLPLVEDEDKTTTDHNIHSPDGTGATDSSKQDTGDEHTLANNGTAARSNDRSHNRSDINNSDEVDSVANDDSTSSSAGDTCRSMFTTVNYSNDEVMFDRSLSLNYT